MSAGAFSRSKYQTNDANVVPVRVQPETISAGFGQGTNAPPAGSVIAGFPSANVSRSRRSIGIHVRTVTVAFTATPPIGYLANQTYSIPVLTSSVWDAIVVGSAGTYLGTATEVVSKSPEIIR